MDRAELLSNLKALKEEDLLGLIEELKPATYWLLSYDIPEDDLSELVRRSIRRYAVMVHESGYVVHAKCKVTVEELIKEAILAADEKRREDGKSRLSYTRVRWCRSDRFGDDQTILDWTSEAMDRFNKEITESFEKRMANVVPKVEKAIEEKKLDVNEKAKTIADKKKAILRDLKRRVEDAESAFVWFAMTNKVHSALKASRDLFEAELLALKEVTQLGETALVQSRLDGPDKLDALAEGS